MVFIRTVVKERLNTKLSNKIELNEVEMVVVSWIWFRDM
jgi:hypothetical protein